MAVQNVGYGESNTTADKQIDEISARHQEFSRELEAAVSAANFHASQAARQRVLARAAYAALTQVEQGEPQPADQWHPEQEGVPMGDPSPGRFAV